MIPESTAIAIELYRSMLLIRACEETLAAAHREGLVLGACHTCVGQEAVPAGICSALGPEDVVFSTHRGHGHALARGVAPEALFSELLGRAAGCSRGRGGSMHLFAPEVGLMGTSGIVGPSILQAAGAAYSFQLLEQPRVAVAFFGDGAVNNGAFHEGLNLAGIWRLPALFVCENNQYATEVPFQYSAAVPEVAERARSYGVEGVSVDGNDALAVRRAALAAAERARAGRGPTLIECRTYRTRAHAEGMTDFTYRTREEVSEWLDRCPLRRLRDVCTAGGADLDAVHREVERQVEQAMENARHSAWPAPRDAASQVFAAPRLTAPPPEREGQRLLTYTRASLEALAGEMRRDPRIFVLGEGIGKRGGNFGTTTGLYDEFGPLRLRDTPICERGFIGLATGAAITGTRPVIDVMFWDFALDGLGEIINQLARMRYMSSGRLRAPAVIRGCIGIGHSAATHHSGNHVAVLGHYPGLRVIVPATPYAAKGLLTHALRSEDPVCILEPRELLGTRGHVPEESYELPFGRAAVAREGTDISLVTFGASLPRCLAAAGLLAAEGVSAEVLDLQSISPLDEDAVLNSLSKTGRLLVVDEGFEPFGVAAEVAALAADRGFDDLDAPVRRVAGSHVPTPYSPSLEAAVFPGPERIAAAARALLAE